MPSGRRLRRLWRTMPDRQAVTLRPATAVGTHGSGSSVSDCWYRPASGGTVESAPSAGAYTAASRTWFMPKERQAAAPNVGDLIVSAGGLDFDPDGFSWTVLSVSEAGALGVWQCETISLELQAGLRDTCDVYRGSPGGRADGKRAAGLAVIDSAVPCRLQEGDGDRDLDTAGGVVTRRRAEVYLGRYVAALAGDVVVVGGVSWDVTARHDADRIDALSRLSVERVET